MSKPNPKIAVSKKKIPILIKLYPECNSVASALNKHLELTLPNLEDCVPEEKQNERDEK